MYNDRQQGMAGLGDGSSSFDFSSILTDAINAYSTVTQAKTAASILKAQSQAVAAARVQPPMFPGFGTGYNPAYSPVYSGAPVVGGSNLTPILMLGGAGVLLLMLMKA